MWIILHNGLQGGGMNDSGEEGKINIICLAEVSFQP
jgi:hypothetical protein